MLGVRVIDVGGGRFDVRVVVSSPYDSRFRFADGWRVLTSDGDLLGERRFRRHHALEQPWTRTLRRVRIPPEVRRILVEGHDVANGYGGGVSFVAVPNR
ncbi:MAG: hypothetical protein HZB46_10840 [Solirubrobacterales bacterium]|nr:hypothetical protein [Solirubrobacterales bacterium]